MTMFRVPALDLHALQEPLPEGEEISEVQLMERLHEILPPLQTLASVTHSAIEEAHATAAAVEPMLALLFQALYEPVALLDAWWKASEDARLADLHQRACAQKKG